MVPKQELTNENLSKLFSDNFQLAVQAIRLAQSEIKSGKEVSTRDILDKLKKNPHLFERTPDELK